MLGQKVCGSHGGRSPQAKRSAQERLEELGEPAINGLRIALDSGDVKAVIRASIAVLDRTGHHPPRNNEPGGVSPPPEAEALWLDWATVDDVKIVRDIIVAAEARRAAGEAPYP